MRMTALIVLVASAAAGCDSIPGIVLPSRTTVVLRNNGAFPVDVQLFISDQQDIPEFLLTADDGDAEQFTVPAGDQVSFSRDCDQLQAIIIEDAGLQIVGQVGPDASTGVLRDGDDFGCGDAITFTFAHSEVLIDFDVTITVQPAAAP